MHGFTFFFALILCSCATFQSPFNDLHHGMSQDKVRALVGEPDDRTFFGTREEWRYYNERIVIFERANVIGVLEDFEVVRAINAGSPQAANTSQAQRPLERYLQSR